MTLSLINLQVWLGPRQIVGITADIGPGEVLTIMGPSGSGKSTLLGALTGSLPPAFRISGQVLLAGRDLLRLPPQDRRVGLLFQDDLLFPHLTVAGNLAFALPQGIKNRATLVETALTEMDLTGFAPRDPATLSGGQRTRVALARCLLSIPLALALDEPFSRLDTALRAQIRTLVFAHARARNLPVILVTHDPQDAAAAGGEILPPIGGQHVDKG